MRTSNEPGAPDMQQMTTESMQDDMNTDRSNRRWIYGIGGVAGLAAVAWVAVGFFGVHTLFFDTEVAEPPPAFVSELAQAEDMPVADFSMRSGDFVSREHPTSGQAMILDDGAGTAVLRLENFATDNGPDLKVFMVAAPADTPDSAIADDYIDLGRLRGNIGDQNYVIPAGTDLDRYQTVVIWCDRFNVSFGVASLG